MTMEKEKLIQRLKRIEGQVRGLQRMVDEEQPCGEILTQIAAVRAALAGAGKAVFETHSKACIQQALAGDDSGAEAIDDLLQSLGRLIT
ncbi:MAG: metal-sensitive transcriptional regulator [Bacillota bacterium]|jgi:DNA-binding FrmR family transcriptional regulator|nr:metal-sensitive transcriptional regulator [Bacillota bacterium]HHT90461.1 metal-sensitive transcriptional regulator [Bacillota bacterium]